MRIQDAVVLSIRIMIRLGICCFVTLSINGGNVLCQEIKPVKKINGSVLEIGSYMEIPEASEPCAPAECEWWRQLRAAGNDLQRKGDVKSKKKFVLLLAEGLTKSYRVPLLDRLPQKLASGAWPSPSQYWSAMTNGTVDLSIEIRANASIGDVVLLNGLNQDLDQLCIRDARQSIFLPAVKDRHFVTVWHKGGRTFFLAPGVNSRIRRPF